MSVGGRIRRSLYWMKDYFKNQGLVKSQYDDILYILDNPVQGKKRINKYIDDLLKHAADTTEFYRPYQGKEFSEYPVINKTICMENYARIQSDLYHNEKLHKMSTNGSTGTPFTIVQDRRKRSRVIAELKVFMRVCGLESHDPLLFFDALSAKGRKATWWNCWKENIWKYDVFQFEQKEIENMIQFIHRHPGKVLLAYPSAMLCITNYMKEDNRLNNSSVSTIITAGEALHNDVRNNTKKVFGGNCKVLSRYSNQEMGILGQEKDENLGFVMNYGSYYFECLKMDSDEPAEEGQVGRIVITDLFNYAFPLIRYDTGDAGIMSHSGDLQFPVFLNIYGKKNDILYDYQRNPIIPDAIDDMFFGTTSIEQWQIIQEKIGEFTIYIKARELKQEEIELLKSKMKKTCGGNPNIQVKQVDEIPSLGGGKNRFIVCKIEDNDGSIS